MKANYTSQGYVAALTAVFALSSSYATVVNPPTASLEITRSEGTNLARVNLKDPYNHVWVLQSSGDLADWAEVGALKLHNGSFAQSFPRGGSPMIFFRALYDPSRQNIFSTVENALLLPASSFNYAAPVLPASFFVNPILAQDNMPAANVTTDLGATLGRVLFYDKRLSTNQTISCASCHQQAHGFADPRRFSVGFDGSTGTRHAMRIANDRWYQRRHFFWDERANTLEDQVLLPIQNPVEMGMSLTALTNRLAAEPFYTNLFGRTFGATNVTSDRLSRALAQFVRSIISTKSKYDAGVSNNFANFTAQENLGRQIFLGQVSNPPNPPATCAACHGTDNFVPGPALNNNGLEFPYVDLGVGGITGNAADNGKFKVPSLRNIQLTAPYMHDGRFASLAEVVEFYDHGVVDNPNLSPPLRLPPPPGQTVGPVRRLNLTTAQKAALVAFLKTLTDPSIATDEKWSDPFNYGN